MIDLHTHTTYSDGTDSVRELLKKAEDLNLEVLSITDHNGVGAYLELEHDGQNIYHGKIIVGCEFTTTYKGKLIEVLGYNFDVHKMDKYLNKIYSQDKIKETTTILKKRLLTKIKQLGLEFHIENVQGINYQLGFFEKAYYNEIIKYPDNLTKISEPIMNSFSDFYRKGLMNPNSYFFIDAVSFKVKVQDLVDKIHEYGGIAFLAHPYQYKLDNIEEYLYDLYSHVNLDGIECYYTNFSKEQTQYLLMFAKEHNLLISGGSDTHGFNKKNIYLGVGHGNMSISKSILDNWKI